MRKSSFDAYAPSLSSPAAPSKSQPSSTSSASSTRGSPTLVAALAFNATSFERAGLCQWMNSSSCAWSDGNSYYSSPLLIYRSNANFASIPVILRHSYFLRWIGQISSSQSRHSSVSSRQNAFQRHQAFHNIQHTVVIFVQKPTLLF